MHPITIAHVWPFQEDRELSYSLDATPSFFLTILKLTIWMKSNPTYYNMWINGFEVDSVWIPVA